jgi:hypothetical protein
MQTNEQLACRRGAESFSADAKCIPGESISARTSVRSVSGDLVPNEKELLEAALWKCSRHSLAGNLEFLDEPREYMNGEVCRRS